MNKPMQAIEPSNYFSPDAAGAAKKGRNEDGESSFSSIARMEAGDHWHPPGEGILCLFRVNAIWIESVSVNTLFASSVLRLS